MNYFQKLSEENDREMTEQIEATAHLPKSQGPITLSFFGGEFVFKDGEEKATGKVNGPEHIQALVAKATEIAKEKKARLIVSDSGSAVLAYCKNFTGKASVF